MADYSELKQNIASVIKSNNRREITGQILQNVLNQMVGSLGENYQLAGFAEPTTNPQQPDQTLFYIAEQAGVYTNFDNITLGDGLSFLMWKNSEWTSHTIGVATHSWVDSNYVSKAFLRQIFRVYDADGFEILPNDTTSIADNIKAMVGLWTNEYLSALGLGDDGQTGAQYLTQLGDVDIDSTTLADGQVLVYDNGLWVNGQAGGVDMSVVWAALAGNTNEQINASHLTTALTGYVTSSSLSTTLADYVTTTALNTALASYASQSWVSQNYVSIAFLNRILRAYDSTDTQVQPNDTTTAIDNLKAMVGLWTEQYLSALGQGNDGGGGGYITTLGQLEDVLLTTPSVGQALVYAEVESGVYKWINGTAGVDMSSVWTALAGSTNEQIALSHLTTALSGYVTTGGLSTTLADYVTATALSTTLADYVTATSLSTTLASYATQQWVGQNYVSIAFFNRLFAAYDSSDVIINPNDTTTAVDNIKALVGLWTQQYLSALGQGSDGGGGQGDVTWALLADNTDTRQIALSHLTSALTGYATTSQLASYLPLAGGTLSGNLLVSADKGANIGSASARFYYNYMYRIMGLQSIESSTDGTYRLTLPSKSGTIAVTSDIPTNNNQLTNGAGYITGITSSMVTTALGYTPANSSSLSDYLPLSGGTLTGSITLPTININSSSGDDVITFARGNYNYLRAKTSGGAIAFITDGKTMEGNNVDMAVGNGWVSINKGVEGAGGYNLNVGGSLNATTIYQNGVALGSRAFDSTSYLPLTGGTLTGELTVRSSGGVLIGKNGNTINGGNESSYTHLYLNYHSNGNVGICYGGGNVGIGILSPTYKLQVNGIAYASSFVKEGGTSSQFLKGDGSVDSNTYALSSSLLSYLPLTGGQLTGDLTLYTSTSGETPSLIFQRGTLSDSPIDWRIKDNGGDLYFDYNREGTWYSGIAFATHNNGIGIDGINTYIKFARQYWNYICVPASGGNIGINIGGEGTAQTKMCVLNNGYVGIGTTSPSYLLDVNGTISISGNILTSSLNGTYVQIGGIRLVYDSANNALKVVGSDGSTAANFYATGGVSALGATSDGTSYLPTTGGQLTGDLTLYSAGGDSPSLIFQRGTLSDTPIDWRVQDRSGDLCFDYNTNGTWTNAITFATDGQGNVNMLGNASSATKLKTARTIWGQNFDGASDINNVGISGIYESLSFSRDTYNYICVPSTGLLCFNIGVAGTAQTKMMIINNGNVGIGTTYPSYKLEVSGQVGATGFVNTSDIRKKTKLSDIDLSIESIAKAPAFTFMWNDKTIDTDIHVGSSAQYWREVLPNVVSEADDEIKTLSMQYGVAALVASITTARKVVDHEKRLDEQEALIREQGFKISELQRECAELRNENELLKLKIA